MAETAADVSAGAPVAAIDRGTVEVVRKRLEQEAGGLATRVRQLDERRRALFGASHTELLATVKVPTENACVARDLVAVGERLLLACEVRLGLRSAVAPADVFTELAFVDGRIEPRPLALLAGEAFAKDFREVHAFFKDARLLQLRRTDERLLAAFQTGQRLHDVKALRWTVRGAGAGESLEYADNRGDRDYAFPPSHDFAWTRATRELHVHGAFPHINILDTVFVECIGGDLTIKIENNTATGAGVFSEPVKDGTQGLDDAEIHFAALEGVILLRIRPYRENAWRHIVFNRLTRQAVRIDAIGSSCQQLPEGHGLVFPGGYYLASGAHRVFPHDAEGMEFVRLHRAPNGEDLAYVFYRRDTGVYAILRYNLISREVDQPLMCHGYCLLPDGRMIALRAEPEPTRLHTLQIWRTPFAAEAAPAASEGGGFLGRLGNRELVRSISDLLHVQRSVLQPAPTVEAFADVLRQVSRVRDSYHWLGHDDACGLLGSLQGIESAASAFLDEFEKASQLAAQAAAQIGALEAEALGAARKAALGPKDSLEAHVAPLTELRRLRGAAAAARAIPRADEARLRALDAALAKAIGALSTETLAYLGRDDALAPYLRRIAEFEAAAASLASTAQVREAQGELDAIALGLDALVESVNALAVGDAAGRTAILERISEVYAQANRARALAAARRRELGALEGRAAFAAQGMLFAQAVSNALALCDTPERCERELARLALALEELEARFADFDEAAEALAVRREELAEAFDGRRQALLDARQSRCDALGRALARLAASLAKRAAAVADAGEVQALFATDAMALKAAGVIEELRALGDHVRADDAAGRIKAAREDALRRLRDRSELFDGDAVRLGRHRFSANRHELELSMLARSGDDGPRMFFHVAGTDYAEPVDDAGFAATRRFWEQPLPSEDATVYRGEWLAWQVLASVPDAALRDAARSRETLLAAVRAIANARPDDGYERGVHDVDAAAIVERLLHLRDACGRLRFPPLARAAAVLAWAGIGDPAEREALRRECRALLGVRRSFGDAAPAEAAAKELAGLAREAIARHGLPAGEHEAELAGRCLVEELGGDGEPRFARSAESLDLERGFAEHARLEPAARRLLDELPELAQRPAAAWRAIAAWLGAFAARHAPQAVRCVAEATAFALAGERTAWERVSARTAVTIDDALGTHARVRDRRLELVIDDVEDRLSRFARETEPAWRAYHQQRRALVAAERTALRLGELRPKVLTSFVRNRLVDEVYLPLVGDNLAKQIGALGEGRRTDSMGLLLLISPPGYGKTTLVEYVASVLGLAFVKVDGPAIGHAVTSLDPAEAPNATARHELEKLNLAFAMGNNVMLILDDIQHLSPELLQKFIPLCDGSRRIEGVWRGQPRAYDMRGKKFAVVMAGNPYTESGERFRVPDMLANRADIYNLGEILGGHREAFELSYLENCLVANPTLSPLASRPRADFARLLRLAGGDEAARGELEHPYAAAEVDAVAATLRILGSLRDRLVRINQAYIASAASADAFRTEPPFKLQGSYRNMAKLAARVSPLMTPAEVDALLLDHYTAEAQTLTHGAEANLLKLRELLGLLTPAESARWTDIRRTFARRQETAGAADDPVALAAAQLVRLNEAVGDLRAALERSAAGAEAAQDARDAASAQALQTAAEAVAAALGRLEPALAARAEAPAPPAKVEIINTLPKYYAGLYRHHVEVIERSLVPAVEALAAFAGSSAASRDELRGIAADLRRMIEAQGRSQSIAVEPPDDDGRRDA